MFNKIANCKHILNTHIAYSAYRPVDISRFLVLAVQ